MKINIAKTLVFCLFSIAVLIYFQSCYTAVRDNEGNKTGRSNSPADSLPPGYCIVEGVVHDYAREVQSMDMEMDSVRVFFLDNYFWVYNPPSYSIKYIFLEGVDISYVNKQVRIVGTIQNAPSAYYVNAQDPLNIRVYASKIEILK